MALEEKEKNGRKISEHDTQMRLKRLHSASK